MDILTVICLIVGFVFLIKGADVFVDGASELATKLKVPSIIIGLTIVAFGTSAPEAAVSVASGLAHSNAIAVSNVIGSNIFNLLVVIGVTAILCKMNVDESLLKQDYPVLLVSTLLFIIFIVTGNNISQIEGIIFLLLIIAYVVYLVYKSMKGSKHMEVGQIHMSMPQIILYIIIGLVGILVGGNLVVDSAKEIALSLGMSETLVGLTIVSIGTSLPELITSVAAVHHDETDIAIGNAVGSSIFNILFIIGLTTTISPIATDMVMLTDSVILIVLTAITYLLALYRKDFDKKDGILMIILFIIYMVFIILRN